MSKVKVEELTIKGVVYIPKDSVIPESKVIEVNGEDSLWVIGNNYLIRTVTMIQLGTLKAVTDKELLLSDACWVADTGRFHEALESGSLNEIEMFQRDVIVGRGSIIDATEWLSNLPKSSK